MICEPCLQGGWWNTQWRMSKNFLYVQKSVDMHMQCAGSSKCVCQHAAGVDSLVVSDVAG
jgi:hypothetical protein